MEARGGIEPPCKDLQSSASPLRHRAAAGDVCGPPRYVNRRAALSAHGRFCPETDTGRRLDSRAPLPRFWHMSCCFNAHEDGQSRFTARFAAAMRLAARPCAPAHEVYCITKTVVRIGFSMTEHEFRGYAASDGGEPAADDRGQRSAACSRRWARCRANASCRPTGSRLAYADALDSAEAGPRPQFADGARQAADRGAARRRAIARSSSAPPPAIRPPCSRSWSGRSSRSRRMRSLRRWPAEALGRIAGQAGLRVRSPRAVRRRAPYDLILIDGAVETVPQALIDQLAEGGRLATGVDRGRA